MDTVQIAAVAVVGFYFWYRTVASCMRFGAKWLPLVLSLDVAAAMIGNVFGFLIWKLWLFYAFARWEPLRGLFRLPRWPRAAYMRGPGRRRARHIPEPPAWQRGPCSW